MTDTSRPADPSRAVGAGAILDYMTRHGWEPRPFPRDEVRVFVHPSLKNDDGKPITLLVPASERLADYRAGVQTLVHALSVIEDRPQEDVLRELTGRSHPGRPDGFHRRVLRSIRSPVGFFILAGLVCAVLNVATYLSLTPEDSTSRLAAGVASVVSVVLAAALAGWAVASGRRVNR